MENIVDPYEVKSTVSSSIVDPFKSAPKKSEGLVEDFLKPLGKAAVRVHATIVGGLGSSMVGGIAGLGAAATQPVKNILYGTKVDPLTAANTELERWGKKTQYVQTPEEEESLNYIMKVMKPVEMAGEGLAGLTELAATGDSQKATDVIEGRSAGTTAVSKSLIPAAATVGQTSALFGLPTVPKKAVGVKNIVRDVMYEKSGLKGTEGIVKAPEVQPPIKPISDPWLKDRLQEASLQETLRPKEVKPQGTYWDYLDQMGKAERWSAKEAMKDLPEEVRKSYERDFAPELPEGKLDKPAEVELPIPEQLSGFDQLKLETLRDTDPALWSATDKVFMEKLGERAPEPIQGAAEKPELFVPEQYGEAKTPEKLAEAYRPSGKTFKEPTEPPTTFQEVWEAGTETTEKPGFTITDKRTFKNILDDINTTIGKEGKVGEWERSPESLAARERLKEDLKRLTAEAKLAGKDVAQYLKDVGMSDEVMLAFARLQRETRDQKAAEQRGDFVADRSSYVPSRDTRSAAGDVSKIDTQAEKELPFKFQNSNQEQVYKEFKNGQYYRYNALEGAGDVFRELALREEPDFGYISEKISHIENQIKQERRGIHPDDSFETSRRENQDAFKKLEDLWSKQPVTSEIQKVAVELNKDMLRGDFTAAEKNIQKIKDYFKEPSERANIGADIEARTNAALSAAKSQPSVEQSQSILGKVKDKLKSEAGAVVTAEKKPFYSKLEEVINRYMKMNMPVDQLRKMAYSKDVTVDEWNDVFGHLRGKVTKGQLLDELAVHGRKFEDVVLGETSNNKNLIGKTVGEPIYNAMTGDRIALVGDKITENIVNKVHQFGGERINTMEDGWVLLDKAGRPQYERYSEPGYKPGSYRELFVTAPRAVAPSIRKLQQEYSIAQRKLQSLFESNQYRTPEYASALEEVTRLNKELKEKGVNVPHGDAAFSDWQDGHTAYSNIQNPIVRIRFTERVVGGKGIPPTDLPKGWRLLEDNGVYKVIDSNDYIVEIRDYSKTDTTRADARKSIIEDFGDWKNEGGKRTLFVEEIQGPRKVNQAKMPESLRSRIYDIGVKRVVSYAKENGFDEIAWTNGKMQADRYNLARVIDNINWEKPLAGKKLVEVYSKDGREVDFYTDAQGKITDSHDSRLIGKSIEEVVGKEVAKKILNSESGNLSNLDLEIGGEGLKRLYDEVIPGLMEKYGGGKVKKNSTVTEKASTEYITLKLKDAADMDIFKDTKAIQELNDIAFAIDYGIAPKEALAKYGTTKETFEVYDRVISDAFTQNTNKVSSLPLTEKSPSSFTMYSDPFGANAAFKASKKAISELSESTGVKKYIQDEIELADDYLGAISTRLGNISLEIKYRLRNFEFSRESKITRREKAVLPLFKAIKKMSKEDRAAFDIARKNGRTKEVNAIASKYGVQNELANVRQVLDELYSEARKVGFRIKRNPEYHPREVTDFTGLMEYLHKTEGWTTIDTAIKAKEQKLQRYLTDQEKVKVVNSLLRGYATEQITLSKPGQLKARMISEITPELDKFYADSDSALLRYITDITDIIEARRLFGRTAKKYEGIDIDNSIGAYIIDLKSKGKLSPAQERELTKILKARFHEVGTSGVVGLYKNLAYIDTMGSAMSAVTQVGDAAFSIHKYGLGETVKGLSQAVGKKSRMTREDLGISRRIASEFSDKSRAAKAVDTVFRSVGLTGIDSIFKSTAINAAYNSAVKLARNPKTEAAFRKKLEPMFEKETDAVMEEFKNGEVTENTKFYVFNEIADIQPIALSEMPLKYLTGGNGRIFYMLKTYTTKMLDVYRNEVYNKIKTPGQRTEGIKNLISLTAALVVMNTGADVIKDVLFGRPVVLEDHVVDNIWRTVGASRYTVEKAKRDGIGSTLVQQILPPTKAIDAAYKDIKSAGDGKGSELVQSIPVFGKFYYWWFGKGADKSTKIAAKVAKDRYYKMAMEDKEKTGEISSSTAETIRNDMRLSDNDLNDLWKRVQIGDDHAYKVSKMPFDKALKEFEKASVTDRKILGKVLADKYDRLSEDKKAKFDPEIERILAEEKKEPLVDVSKLIFGKESMQ